MKSLFLFSGNNDLGSPGGAREGGRWAQGGAQLGYLGLHGDTCPCGPGKGTLIPAAAAAASQQGQLPHKQVT